MPSPLHKGAVERIKRLSGVRFRSRVAKQERFSTAEFWTHQKQEFLARYKDAITNVPYYATNPDMYPRVLNEDGSVLEILAQLPILPKSVVKDSTEQFWRRPAYFGTAQHTTGGTTGAPLRIRASLRERGETNAILEQRYLGLVGTRQPRILRLSGFLDDPNAVWMRIPGSPVAYVSIYALRPSNRSRIIRYIIEFRPQVVHGYASAIAQLALLLEGHDVVDTLDLTIISTSETLAPEQRTLIQRALRAPVLNEYGSQEGQHLVLECTSGSMHVHPARGVVELLEPSSTATAGPGELGRVVVTGYQLGSMPLFRYDIGDTAISCDYAADCACGSAWPTIGTVFGRTEDLIRTPDGRRIGLLSHSTLKDIGGVREAQIIQLDYARFIYRIVPDHEFERVSLESHVQRQLTSRLGYPVRVSFEYVQALPRTPSGKLQAVVVNFEEPEKGSW